MVDTSLRRARVSRRIKPLASVRPLPAFAGRLTAPLDVNETRTYTAVFSQNCATGTPPMPEIAAASPAPSCSLLLFRSGIQEFQTLDTDLFSPRARVRARRVRWTPILQWDDQQRVDLLAVEDDQALDKAIGFAGEINSVEIAADGKEAHLAVMHDPHGDKIGMCLRHRYIDPLDADRADDV